MAADANRVIAATNVLADRAAGMAVLCDAAVDVCIVGALDPCAMGAAVVGAERADSATDAAGHAEETASATGGVIRAERRAGIVIRHAEGSVAAAVAIARAVDRAARSAAGEIQKQRISGAAIR